MAFMQPVWLLLMLLLPLLWWKLRNRYFVGFSTNRLLKPSGNWNRLMLLVPPILFSAAFCLFVIGLARPQESHIEGNDVIRTRDILLTTDISGSMEAPFAGEIPPPEKGNTELDKELPKILKVRPPDPRHGFNGGFNGGSTGGTQDPTRPKTQRRIDAAQAAIMRFIRHRYIAEQSDRVAIMTFDTEPHWSWPLTDDLKQVYRKGVFIDQGLGGGTNFGNMDPGPIDAACQHFDEQGKAATRVLIMITDGEDQIYPEAFARLQKKLTERGVRFYVIGVGETLARRNVDIIRLADAVGGTVFRVENASDLAKCFDSIDQMERTEVKIMSTIGYHDVFYRYVLVALGVFLLGALAEAFIVSR